MDIQEIARQINKRAVHYRIGEFQEIRKKLKGYKSRSSKKLFSDLTIFDTWAMHHGGREEIQFNMGFEGDNHELFRHGVAFSLQPSRNHHDITILLPKIERFNDYIREEAHLFSDMKIWLWHKKTRRQEYPSISEIPSAHFEEGNFIFMGKRYDVGQINYDIILHDFDRLLNLYEYVEGDSIIKTSVAGNQAEYSFKPGIANKKSSTTASLPERRLNIELRHNDIQSGVYNVLAAKYGKSNVGSENAVLYGKKIDLVVRTKTGHIFFEIKTSSSIQSCIREALSQLLEYAFWPDNNRAEELIVVTENDVTDEARKYLLMLRSKFNLPIYHQKYDWQLRTLSERH